jgi:DNA-binding transcriptional ArsR family regulator
MNKMQILITKFSFVYIDGYMKEIKIFNDPKAFEIAADKTRRRIIHLLRARELSVAQIADALDMTPQAIYHHIKRMLEVGLIEVAKEERVNHFIETYYQAAAEVYQFCYDIESSKEYSESRFRETLRALHQVGLTKPIDEETASRALLVMSRLNSIHRVCSLEIGEKISAVEGLDAFGKQDAIDIACNVSMSDDQFVEMQKLQGEMRAMLRQYLITL